MLKELKGILPPIVTAFDEEGEVDYTAMRRITRYQLQAGVHGFYVCGGTGEGLLLSVNERKAVLETVLEEVSGCALVVAHIGAFQTADTLELARHASHAGVDAIAALPPSYFFKPDSQALVQYYAALSDASSVPLLVYNLPQRTGHAMTGELFEQLLKIKNIVGMKDSSGNLYSLGLYFSGGKRPVIFSGDDSLLAYALMAGACGGIGGTYNIMPERFVKLWQAAQARDMDAAAAMQLRINEIINALLVVDLFGGVKQTLAWMGLPCGLPRTPNRPLTNEETTKLRRSLEGVGFFDQRP